MQGNIPSDSAGHYERVIGLMQEYDCSYEDAQRHFQLISQGDRPRLEADPPMGNEAERDEDLRQQQKMGEVEEALRALDVIPFTVRELRTLKLFFSGSLSYPGKKGKSSFCEKTALALKAAKRKMKCFKYLSPKRLWRAISRRRGVSNYDRISSKDPSSPQEERVKADPSRFQRWRQPEEDWADDLEEVAQQLATYLSAHKELTSEVKAMGGEGLRVAVPTTMELPQTLQPYLFVREGSAEIIADNVKEIAEKVFKVVCLDKQYFALLHNNVPDFSEATVCSMAGYNIFAEMQILGTFKGLTAEEVERGEGIFKQFVIKNRLFKSILSKEITQISFAFAAPQDDFEQQQQEQDQEETTKREEIQAQKSIIRQQDMLYQSMLSSYATKQTVIQKQNGSVLQFAKKRQAIRQSIREEPTPGHSTIHITFRTPTGSTVSRHFHKEDSLDYVRNWIITQEQVEFQSMDASFQLYHGYPPTRVEAQKNQTLREAFGEEESKIRVIIKEE